MKFCVTAVYAPPLYIFFSFHLRQKAEKQCLLTSGTTISYHTVLPYAHAIKNDIIQIESSNVVDTNATDTLLFNGTMPDRTFRMYYIYMFLSKQYPCFLI